MDAVIASTLMKPLGREIRNRVSTAGVLIWNDVTDEGRDAFYKWHNGEHMPERMEIAGFVRGRRYANPGQSPEWFTLYEATSLDVLVSKDYLSKLNNPTPATTETLKHFRNTARSVCSLERAVGNTAGGYAVVMRFDRGEGAFDVGTTQQEAVKALEIVESFTGVVSTSLYGSDESASLINTAESKTRPFDVSYMTLLVETSHRAAAEQALRVLKQRCWSDVGVAPRDENGIYQLEVCFV